AEDARDAAGGTSRAAVARGSVRRRLVPEGRDGLGRGPRAEADQGAGPAARRAALPPGACTRVARAPLRSRSRLRAERARAARHPVSAPVGRALREDRAPLPGA